MDIAESIGFIQFWGMSPALNLLESKPIESKYWVFIIKNVKVIEN